MGYPMKKEIKIRLIFMYYEIICKWRKQRRQRPLHGADII
jgi:hypothetical protein